MAYTTATNKCRNFLLQFRLKHPPPRKSPSPPTEPVLKEVARWWSCHSYVISIINLWYFVHRGRSCTTIKMWNVSTLSSKFKVANAELLLSVYKLCSVTARPASLYLSTGSSCSSKLSKFSPMGNVSDLEMHHSMQGSPFGCLGGRNDVPAHLWGQTPKKYNSGFINRTLKPKWQFK